jgi:hypothetical protein
MASELRLTYEELRQAEEAAARVERARRKGGR